MLPWTCLPTKASEGACAAPGRVYTTGSELHLDAYLDNMSPFLLLDVSTLQWPKQPLDLFTQQWPVLHRTQRLLNYKDAKPLMSAFL